MTAPTTARLEDLVGDSFPSGRLDRLADPGLRSWREMEPEHSSDQVLA
jgi:hypothetical protein